MRAAFARCGRHAAEPPPPRALVLGHQWDRLCAELRRFLPRNASEGLRTIVVERDAPGGQAGTSSRIENYLGFRQASPATSSRCAHCSRRGGSAPRSSSRARSRASTRRHARCTSTVVTCCARRRSFSLAASRGGICQSRDSTGSSGKASSTAPPAARLRTRTGWTSTSSGPGTRRVRPRCSSRTTHEA